MPIEVLMPALSPTMTEGKIARWHKKPGDEVHAGDVLAEIETDKATMEMEAVDEGTLARILVPEGTENVAVNPPIAVIASEGESVDAAAKSAKAAPRPVTPQPEAPAARPRRRRARPLPPRLSRRKRNGPARPSRSPCARRCAMPSPRKCGATATCSSWARRSRNIRAPTR